MPPLPRGLYETLLTEALAAELGNLPEHLQAEPRDLELGEAADRLALHVSRYLRGALEDVADGSRVAVGVRLARALVRHIAAELKLDEQDDMPVEPAKLLAAVFARLPDGSVEQIGAPMIPLLDTTLLTNAPDEPRVGRQIEAEIDSADRIDAVIAFVRRSGLRPLRQALARATGRGCPVRVLTTTYTGSTEAAAIEELLRLGAQVRVSYDTTTARLHAKAWLFHRESRFSTAYIGSSNLTHSAQVTGLEWNVRVSGARNPDVIAKVAAVFESYWEGGEFSPYDAATFARSVVAPQKSVLRLSPIELRLEPFQERLLEQIGLERERGRHRNLLVSATGTGKTVMAAVDYARLREKLPRSRLLFVAHRREILEQSLDTFRHALRDPAFGELWVADTRPSAFEHLFASIQTLSGVDLSLFEPDRFDVVIVDEFHHAAARTYETLLAHVRPRELLGLTATPERSDGLSVLEPFDGRIAAELRLWDAIDQQRLVPFLYYGIHDRTDLREVPWSRSRGYDIDALSKVLTADEALARLVLKQLIEHVDDLGQIRCLGFCVSVAHAQFMSRVFENAGVRATAVWGDSPAKERERALRELAQGSIQVLFSVDLFNEGVDLPTVDTLMLLRPTESPTLFLQQLGRGLRKAQGKVACTVLDFVGLHRKEFRLDRRFRALLGGSRDELMRAIQGGFPFLPAGCHMELDAVAREHVLRNIKEAIPTQWAQKAAELAQIAEAEGEVPLATFLEKSGLELEDVYRGGRSWSDLLEEARLQVARAGPEEKSLRRACARMLHVDDSGRIEGWRNFLRSDAPPHPANLTRSDRRLLKMLVASMVDQAAGKDDDLTTGAMILWQHPQVRAELLDLLDVLETRVSHLTVPLATPKGVPLRVHASYTRIEILAATGVRENRATVPSWQTGVQWVEETQSDVFAFTLDKTGGNFSPTTRYRDYAINHELIHWESQSVTRADSDTGRRYRHHEQIGSHVLLFARRRQSDRAFFFLGPATYVSHQGERPMAITWKLDHSLPGDVLTAFAAAVA